MFSFYVPHCVISENHKNDKHQLISVFCSLEIHNKTPETVFLRTSSLKKNKKKALEMMSEVEVEEEQTSSSFPPDRVDGSPGNHSH